MSRPSEGKLLPAACPPDQPLPGDLQAGLDGSACLGAWSHDIGDDRMSLSDPLARVLGIARAEAGIGLATVLSCLRAEDRLRIESLLHAATESGCPFEAELRTRPGPGGVRCLRLMGRCERISETGAARIHGLAFDLTEGRLAPGTPAQRAQRQVNQLADHVIAMQGLVASLSNPPLSKLVEAVAVEVGFELARRLHASEAGPQH